MKYTKPNYKEMTMRQLFWNITEGATIGVKTKEEDEILTISETMVESFMNKVNKNYTYDYRELLDKVERIATQDYNTSKERDMVNSIARGLARITEEISEGGM